MIRTAALAFLLCTSASIAAPLPTRDQNPLTASLGLPMPLPARIAPREWTLETTLNWASTALMQESASETLLVDAETRELRVRLMRPIAERFAIQLQVPYRYTGAGTLDAFIDSWHDFFGLPSRARRLLPEDQYRIAYVRDGGLRTDISSSSSGLADVSLDFGYSLLSRPDTSAAAWLSIELPTGEEEKLTGNESTDVSLSLAADHRLDDKWSVYAQGAVTRTGGSALLDLEPRRTLWSALVGIAWHATPAIELELQLDGHGGAFERTGLDYLSDSLVLTLGGRCLFSSGWRLDLAVSEDIAVETAPDVVLIIGLSRVVGRR